MSDFLHALFRNVFAAQNVLQEWHYLIHSFRSTEGDDQNRIVLHDYLDSFICRSFRAQFLVRVVSFNRAVRISYHSHVTEIAMTSRFASSVAL